MHFIFISVQINYISYLSPPYTFQSIPYTFKYSISLAHFIVHLCIFRSNYLYFTRFLHISQFLKPSLPSTLIYPCTVSSNRPFFMTSTNPSTKLFCSFCPIICTCIRGLIPDWLWTFTWRTLGGQSVPTADLRTLAVSPQNEIPIETWTLGYTSDVNIGLGMGGNYSDTCKQNWY